MQNWSPLPAEHLSPVAIRDVAAEEEVVVQPRLEGPGPWFLRLQLTPGPPETVLASRLPLGVSPTGPTAPELVLAGIFQDPRTHQSVANFIIRNTGVDPLGKRLLLIVDSINPASVSLDHPDAAMPGDGRPYFDFSGQLPGTQLDPGEITASRPIVFNNPFLQPFELTVTILSEPLANPPTASMSLRTDENQSVIMRAATPPFSGVTGGQGEELTITLSDTPNPTIVTLSQEQVPGGRGQVFFGNNDIITPTTVPTSGGTPNQARVLIRHARTSGFKGDIRLRAQVGGLTVAEKYVTALQVAIKPQCIYFSDQRNAKTPNSPTAHRTLTTVPAMAGLKFDVQTYAVAGKIAFPTTFGLARQLGGGSAAITTTANGLFDFPDEPLSCQAYVVDSISPTGDGSTPTSPPAPTTQADYYTDTPSDPKSSSPLGIPAEGDTYCETCPHGSPNETGGKCVDLSDGEEKLFETDLTIPGRGLDFRFYRFYRAFSQRRPLDPQDFGEHWTFSYAGEFLVKDGLGADGDANYAYLRDGQAGYLFVRIGDGTWSPPTQQFAQLHRDSATGEFRVRERDGTVRIFNGFGVSGVPNANGRLKEMRDRNGNRLTFHYRAIDPDGTPGSGDEKMVLAFVVDTLGREIRYQYYSATTQTEAGGRATTVASANTASRGRLARVQDFKGVDFPGQAGPRALVFDYDAEGNLVRASGPVVTGTPNANDFPQGRTWRYRYLTSADLPPGLSPAQDALLHHKLTHIWRPNEVGNTPEVDPAADLAASRLEYITNPTDPFFAFVRRYHVGGINASGVPAGGTIEYNWTDLNPTRAMGPGMNVDPTALIHLPSLRCAVRDRNGNESEFLWGGEHRLLQYRQKTRGLRPGEPAEYVTTYRYNRDRMLLERPSPMGNALQLTYNQTSPDRFQQANLLRQTRVPDATRGGDQPKIETVFVYEPIYNRPCLIVSPRGADMANNGFVPPVPDLASRIMTDPYDPARMLNLRYAQLEFFDFQESTTLANAWPATAGSALAGQTIDGRAVLATEVLLVRELGLPETAAGLRELRDRLSANLTHLGLGDLNGDGLADPTAAGNVVRSILSSPVLQAGSNQAAIEALTDPEDLIRQDLGYAAGGTSEGAAGGRLQTIVTLHQYNAHGQLTRTISPEGNVSTFDYYPETDPDGDGTHTPTPADGRSLDTATGGYLRAQVADATRTYFDQVGVDRSGASFNNNRVHPAETDIRSVYAYDDVGHVIQQTNPRGIRTDFFVNELGEVLETTRAADISGAASANPPDPLASGGDDGLIAFAYRTRTSHDFNGNTTRQEIEDRGNTSNTGGFVETTWIYDILDHRITQVQEVDVSLSLTTQYRYDANENRIRIVHPAGNADGWEYDERNLLFRSTRGIAGFDRPGGAGTVPSTTTFHYDRNGNQIEVIDAEPNGGATSTLGGVGDVTRVFYDGFDRRARAVDPLGNETRYNYDPESNVTRVMQNGDPLDDQPGAANNRTLAVTESIHDERGRVVATHRVLFQTPDVAPIRVPTLTDTLAMDALATYLQDASSDTADVPGAIGISVIGRVTTLTEYDREGRKTFTVQDDLDTYRTDYDGANRQIRTLDSALNNGFVAGTFDPAILSGNSVQDAYDDDNNLIERLETDVTDIPDVAPEEFRTTYLYDALDRPQTTFNNRGHTTDYRYDSRNNLVATADAQGPVGGRTGNRRGLGSTASVTLNDYGNVTLSFHDGLNRLVLSETILTASGQGDGTHIGATLDGVKVPTPAPDPNQSEDGKIQVWRAYDENGELLALRDDLGNTTGYIYDNQSRLLKERKGMNAGFQDARFTITGGDSASFNEPRMPPDPLSHPPVETEAANTDNGTTITHAYDRDHNLVQVLDEAGNVRDYTYDALSRRKTLDITRAAGFIGTTRQTWKYDGLSRLASCTDDNEPATTDDDVRCTYSYDSLNRKIEETQRIGLASTKAISWDYEIDCACGGSVGLPSTCTYPDGRRIHSSYDRLDRLVSRNDEGFSDIGKYQYIGKGRVAVLTFQNGTRLTHIGQHGGLNVDVGYDNLRRIVNHRWERFIPGVTPLDTGTLVVGFGHQEASGAPAYDRMNNKLIEEKFHDPGNSEIYVYDSAYRLADPGAYDYRGINGAFRRGTLNAAKTDIETLTIATGELQQQDWNLDGLGNWTQATHTSHGGAAQTEKRTHSDFNEIVGITGAPYGEGVTGIHALDKNGNLIDDDIRIFAWDALNRLRTVMKKSTGDVVGTYTYDCSNRRLRKVVSNSGIDGTATDGTTEFYYDDWRVLEEQESAAATTKQYIYGNYVDEVVAYSRTIGGVVEMYYAHYNNTYSVAVLTDEVGEIVEKYKYDAYGKQIITGPTGLLRSTSALEFERGFTGYVADNETRLMYAKNRMYSYELGRFVSRDPWKANAAKPSPEDGYPNGYNLYEASFVPGDLDPSGTAVLCEMRTNRQLTGPPPLPNGCGAAGGPSFPNGGPGYDFTDACNTHDICYGTCGMSKNDCDVSMLRLMELACQEGKDKNGSKVLYGQCMKQATIYYNSIRWTPPGQSAYESAQDIACEWAPFNCCDYNKFCTKSGPRCRKR